MTRYHNVNGERIKFTELEEKHRDLEEKQNILDETLKVWLEKMQLSDINLMRRELEEHIQHDHNGITNSLLLQKSYDMKKQLRKSKPD